MPTPLVAPGRRLGKRAPIRDPRTLRLQNYLTKQLPPAPTQGGYWLKIRDWPMYLNDQIGDCVFAAAGHMIQQWTTYDASPVVLPDAVILEAYQKVSGFDPNDPSTDVGAALLPALKYWRKTGYAGHKVMAYVSVNPKNRQEVMQAVYLFGNLYAGVQLPLSVQDATDVWEVPSYGPNGDGSPASWGGHCVPIIAYNTDTIPGLKVVTWGTTVNMTWNFVNAYVDELWAVLSLDWTGPDGEAPSGFDLAQLQADLRLLT